MSTSGGPSGPPLPDVTRRSLLLGAGGVALAAPGIVGADVRKPGTAVVVGAGVFGVWTAAHLAEAGLAVTVVDPFGAAHARASSGGESRMTRAGYGKDTVYTRMARDSLPQWKRLNEEAGLPIFVPHGVLFFFNEESAYLRDSMAAHRALGLPTEALTAADIARRFPAIDPAGIAGAMFEPGFGALMARRAVQTLAFKLQASGRVRFVLGQAVPPDPGSSGVPAIATREGERLAADHIIFACGPWLPKLFPALLQNRIVATRQEVFTFAPPPGDRRFQAPALPGWADFNGGDVYYGFPDLEGRGVKFAHDAHGVEVDPDTQDRRPSGQALAEIIAFRDRRFPALRGAQLLSAEVCQYENSSNGDFLIDRHPSWRKVLLVGGGSGHGFKHGPEVGRMAAELALAGKSPDPRFSLATKGLTQKREVI